MDQAKITQVGSTKMAIWMEEPMAIASARSILFFIATMTAVMCSTALPASGSSTTDRKLVGRPEPSAMPSIEPVINLQPGYTLNGYTLNSNNA